VILVDEPRTHEFLDALKELCDRFGADISGCGCCGSPVVELDNQPVVEHLNLGRGALVCADCGTRCGRDAKHPETGPRNGRPWKQTVRLDHERGDVVCDACRRQRHGPDR